MRRLLAVLALLLTLAFVETEPVSADPPVPGYTLAFNDEFNGTTLSDLWEPETPVSTNPEPGELTISNGVMRMVYRSAPPYGTGDGLWTNLQLTGQCNWFTPDPNCPILPAFFAIQEGYFEARIRYQNNPWVWPVFWLWSVGNTQTWPNQETEWCPNLTSEWDIMENGYGVINSNLHRNTNNLCGVPDNCCRSVQRFQNNANKWHVWGGLWTADQVCLYMDGAQVGCMATYDSTAQPMHLLLTIARQNSCPGCPNPTAELWMDVDYVRIYLPS